VTPGVHEERAAGRPANVRALARANQCAAECVAYACTPVKYNTATDFFFVSRRGKGEIGRRRNAASSTIPYVKPYSNK